MDIREREQCRQQAPSDPSKSESYGSINERAHASMENCASASVRSRALRKAHEAAVESVRHERLAERLTPEVEDVLFCLQEGIALGLIELPKRERY